MKALSVQEPWATAIIWGGKNIENRTRRLPYRGPLAIHATKPPNTMKLMVDAEAVARISHLPFSMIMDRAKAGIGHLIGTVELIGMIDETEKGQFGKSPPGIGLSSPWFSGPVGYMLRFPEPCEPVPCKGQLGLFEVPCPHCKGQGAMRDTLSGGGLLCGSCEGKG
jgi:hypothetical protein